MSTIEFAIVGLIFIGASAAMVRSILLRHEAVAAWRKAIGANFDTSQRRFATSTFPFPNRSNQKGNLQDPN